MLPLVKQFVQAFIPLFVAIDPIGLAALFLGLGQGVPVAQRQLIARQATLTAGGVALAFLFLGQSIFRALGISVSDFQIAGGLILFVLAARDLVLPDTERKPLPEGFGIVPLGMPLIAGPALLTALLILVDTVGIVFTVLALLVNLLLVGFAFRYASHFARWMGQQGMKGVSKLISLLLAAIAVSLIRRGWQTP